jgi:hypothetical protein
VSKSKQRARATREAQQQAAARARAAQRKQQGSAPARPAVAPANKRGKPPVYRQRRFPKLPWQLKLALAVGWVLVQVLVFFTVENIGTRIALAIISLFAVPLVVVIVRDPSRRPPR